jgi:hypothetical protein
MDTMTEMNTQRTFSRVRDFHIILACGHFRKRDETTVTLKMDNSQRKQ